MNVQDIKKKASPVLRSHGVARASVFGSSVRGTAGKKSDVDLLVRFKKVPGIIDYMRFINQLETVLDCPVDVLTEKTAVLLKPHIEKDLQVIYEE
ncbi:hypothetical protein A3A39_02920 [Candidatus Kaiserbacteria bacterium RIFCSPLOWO2_01_FULL_54_13]|uniref:Polymerase nucleotidyl transferase domain-containing protein n=1 Tax=Candidatus Kaiserbacteria bacterium RIFCSPLOWO2_01_FULL_54_13 TaxID=1798512 RepID=A0A1F6F2U1_9BACT|nr:MAG: hypothetical protein A3A39_02920 [Candidatus Kaiserbacteria bacterium RIFCSPLOWO2_01_FULL_54_13]